MRRRHLTFPFSPFTFHFINMRRRHLTFPFSLFTFHLKKFHAWHVLRHAWKLTRCEDNYFKSICSISALVLGL